MPKSRLGLMLYDATSQSENARSFDTFKSLNLTAADAKKALDEYMLKRAQSTLDAKMKKANKPTRKLTGFRRTPDYIRRVRMIFRELSK